MAAARQLIQLRISSQPERGDATAEMWCREKNDFPNASGAGRQERSILLLLAAQITAHDEAAHAVRHHVDQVYRAPVFVFQRRQKGPECGTESFDRRFPGDGAVVEIKTHVPVGVKHLVGNPECMGERRGAAIVVIAAHEHHWWAGRAGYRLTRGNHLRK